ncbi:MAG: hypothetical protein H6Q37_1072 [Chloroflexi bacterium]|nr:hypothetical protein [Chloroflexota bacterium]
MEPMIVVLGTQVVLDLEFADEHERLTLTILPDAQADFYSGYLGESTPLAQAILGQTEGTVVNYLSGQVHIERICLPNQPDTIGKENAVRRQEQIAQTEKEIAKTNALLFALTVESKWGDYDPDGIEW